jgi:hypothetical protein
MSADHSLSRIRALLIREGRPDSCDSTFSTPVARVKVLLTFVLVTKIGGTTE